MADAYQEVELVFGGATYRIRPTFKIISQIEAATGRACRSIARSLATKETDVSIYELATILWVLLKDKVDKTGPKNVDEIGDILMDEGSVNIRDPLGTFFIDAIRGTKAAILAAADEAAKEKALKENPQTGG